MIPLGLSSAEKQALEATLCGSHSIKVTVSILNNSGDPLSDISNRLVSGQVDIDADADITRTCTLSFEDPRRSLSFDSDSPADGALYLDRMIEVIYSVKSAAAGSTVVDIPVFTGPVSKLDRTDDVVNIEAQGKESMAMGAAWKPMTFKKGTRKVDVIETIMRERAGETQFSLPSHPARIPRDLSVGRQQSPWALVHSVAESMDRQAFYDGRGTLRLRQYPDNPQFRFKSGDSGSVLTSPQISYSTENLRNVIWVKGGVPKGEKSAIQYWEAAPANHPLSPVRLGRNGVPRYLLEVVEKHGIRSLHEAKQVANGRLNRSLMESVEVSCDVLPVPHLEPLDVVRLTTDEFEQPFRLRQFSIPLVTGETMPIGYTKRVSVKPRRNRRR